MIPDKAFKALNHCCKGYKMHLNGQTLESGYKPDYVLRKDNDYIIFESENSGSRKTYIGALMKAAYFLQKDRTGKLIFISTPRKNTKISSIALHLKKYLTWISDKTNMREIYIIDANSYYANDLVLEVGCLQFNQNAIKV